MLRPVIGAPVIGVCLALSVACSKLTEPSKRRDPEAASKASPAPAESSRQAAAPRNADEPSEPDQKIGASHVLVAYKGALRAKPSVTRTQEAAKKRAQQVRKKALAGADFSQLAKEYSDGPSGPRGGSLGSFSRRAMVKAFADAAFALDVGEVSEVVETRFGFHVIKRDR